MRSLVSLASACALVLTALAGPAAAATGPEMVKDIRANGGSNPQNLTDVDGTLFFTAQTGKHGRELWMSDGTEPGTKLVKNIRPGGASSNPESLTDVNGTLFFTADDGSHGSELWMSDGTSVGTAMVKDIRSGANGSEAHELTALGSKLFFIADDGSHGRELWKSNGMAAGTKMVKEVMPGPDDSIPNESELEAVGNRLYFLAFETVPVGFSYDVDLWKSNGTAAGTKRVEDHVAGGPGSGPYDMTDVAGTLFYACNCGSSFSRLWISDGTASGTRKVAAGNANPKPANVGDLTNVNGSLFFVALDEVNSGEGVWTSDGTSSGTDFLGDPSGSSAQIQPQWLTAAGNRLFFEVPGDGPEAGLWTSDGTVPGTLFLQDGVNLFANAVLGNSIFYETGGELWSSNGTSTTMLADIPDSLGPLPEMLNVGGTIFFTADDGTHGTELWRYTP